MGERTQKYMQIYTVLRQNIFAGVYGDEHPSPTEKEIADTFQVSRTTVRNALELLKDEGLIQSTPGRGTDILADIKEENRSITVDNRQTRVDSVTFEFLRGEGLKLTHSDTITDVIPAREEVAAALKIPEGTNVYCIRWLHYANDEPYLYLTNFLRMDLVPDLPPHVKNLESLYMVLKNVYGLEFRHGKEIVAPTTADFITARLLDVEIGTPLTLLQRSAYTESGPLEYAISLIRPDIMQIRLNLA